VSWWRDPLILGLGAAIVAYVVVTLLSASSSVRQEGR
jgi:hypothetical protein